jgi:membrane protease YdiL (CAAX protease family)
VDHDSFCATPAGVVRETTRLFLFCGLGFLAHPLDAFIYRLAASSFPLLRLIADLRIPSLAAVVACILVARPPALRAPDKRLHRSENRIAIYWLVGAAIAVHVFGVGRVPLPRWEDQVSFLVTGVLIEELVFRALVQDAASRVWGDDRILRVPRCVWVSATAFALSHHQYHAFRFDTAAWMQVAWTFPIGIVLGLLTFRYRSILPAIFVHLLNNIIAFV